MNIYSCIDYINIDKILTVFSSCWENCSPQYRNKLKFHLLVDKLENNTQIPKTEFNLTIQPLNHNKLETLGWSSLLEQFNNLFYKSNSECRHIMNFARFFIFDHFDQFDHDDSTCIYLDWDMIVQGNIWELKSSYDICTNENKLVVPSSDVNNIRNLKSQLFGNHATPQICNEFNKHLNINVETQMGFNGGFYITNKTIFNRSNIQSIIWKLIEFQRKHDVINYGTQVIMNLIKTNQQHENEIVWIDYRWNYCLAEQTSYKLIDLADKKIVHFSGNTKPWKTNITGDGVTLWNNYAILFHK
jgi:hypothetical protein